MKIFAHYPHVLVDNIHPDDTENSISGTFSSLVSFMKDCAIPRVVGFAPFPSQCRGTKITPIND